MLSVNKYQILIKIFKIKIKIILIRNKNYKWYLYLYISYNYDFIIIILYKNIYITIFNINMFRKKFYPKNNLNTFYFNPLFW